MELWVRNAFFAILVTSVLSKSLRHSRSVGNSTENSLLANTECNCDWRLLRHYEAKLCQPIAEDECGCPEKFNCPTDNEVEGKQNVCTYKGKEYELGSRINTTNVCQVCKCLGRLKPRMFCMPKNCPTLKYEHGENCHLIYKKDKCCPVGFECDILRTEAESRENIFTCEYEGRHYPLGAKIYPIDDPCQICECTEEWNGTTGGSCYQQDCILEKHKAKLDAGCIPIYHENRCCPIEFYCPQIEASNNLLNLSNNFQEVDQITNGSQCEFAGHFYEVGQELSINHPTKCVKCTCMIPPDFTCVHQSCLQPPNTEHCYSYYSPDQCCPQYECLLGDEGLASATPETIVVEKREMEDELNDENPCTDVKCNDDEKCMLHIVMCGNMSCPPVPTCLKINNECATSTCETGCAVVEQDENNCVTCACGEDISKHVSTVKCQMPRCIGQNCHLAAGDGGCPSCACDEPCTVTECPPGCNVLSEIEGRCPQCVCEDENEGCPTPICEDETCRIETPPGGCPTCICDNKASMANSTLQVQNQQEVNQQSQFEDDETEGQVLGESEESFDNIQLMSELSATVKQDNELAEPEVNEGSNSRIFSNSESGGRQP